MTEGHSTQGVILPTNTVAGSEKKIAGNSGRSHHHYSEMMLKAHESGSRIVSFQVGERFESCH